MLSSSGRTIKTDLKFEVDQHNQSYENCVFTRLVGKNIKFSNVSFKYTHFDGSYLRNCIFDSCDFTGVRFIASNFYGSKFSGCKFSYATFERTIIDTNILSTECPGEENLKLRFARSLRMNFQQIGDVDAVNKAILVELHATGMHLHKAWRSNESYYRKKYVGINRFQEFLKWINFKILDFIWGNGESFPKLIRTILVMLLVIALADLALYQGLRSWSDVGGSLSESPKIFFGITHPDIFNESFLTAINIIRLILFGFFMSIIIKRFNRR